MIELQRSNIMMERLSPHLKERCPIIAGKGPRELKSKYHRGSSTPAGILREGVTPGESLFNLGNIDYKTSPQRTPGQNVAFEAGTVAYVVGQEEGISKMSPGQILARAIKVSPDANNQTGLKRIIHRLSNPDLDLGIINEDEQRKIARNAPILAARTVEECAAGRLGNRHYSLSIDATAATLNNLSRIVQARLHEVPKLNTKTA